MSSDAPNMLTPPEGWHGPSEKPIISQGTLSIPCSSITLGAPAGDGGRSEGFGVLRLFNEFNIGLHVTLSPEGLRYFAKGFTMLASQIEATAADQAMAALAKAKGERK